MLQLNFSKLIPSNTKNKKVFNVKKEGEERVVEFELFAFML